MTTEPQRSILLSFKKTKERKKTCFKINIHVDMHSTFQHQVPYRSEGFPFPYLFIFPLPHPHTPSSYFRLVLIFPRIQKPPCSVFLHGMLLNFRVVDFIVIFTKCKLLFCEFVFVKASWRLKIRSSRSDGRVLEAVQGRCSN